MPLQFCGGWNTSTYAVVKMPEENTQEDVKPEDAAEVASQEADASTATDHEAQADAENVNTEEQPAKPERTVPLNQLIAERTKLKSRIRELETASAKPTESNPASTPETPAAKQTLKAPDMSDPDIDYDQAKFNAKNAEYIRELTLEAARNAVAEDRAGREKAKQETEWNGKLSQFDQNVAKLAQDAPEYAQLMDANGNNGHGDDTITQAIIDSDAGAEIDYYLLANPAEAARISALPERAKLMEMGAIKAKAVEFASSNKTKGSTNQVTQAPRPIQTETAGGGSFSDPRYDPNVSFAEYRAAKNNRAAGA